MDGRAASESGSSLTLKSENLHTELEAALKRIAELEEVERVQSEISDQLQKTSKHLEERVKELNCLYSISKLRESPELSIDDLLQGIVDIIPPAWSYPETTRARLTVGSRLYETPGFRPTSWTQTCVRKVNATEEELRLKVCYLDERPPMDVGPFLKEEQSLLNTIGENILEIILRKHSEDQSRVQREHPRG